MRPDQINSKWNNYSLYVDNAKSLGKLLLLARRLCEAGCRFVTVTTNFVWDMHADVNNAGVHEGIKHLVATMLQRLVDPGELRLVRGMPNEAVQSATADSIPGL